MRSFVKTKSARNGIITLSYTDECKSCHSKPLESESQLQQTTNFATSFPIFEKNKVRYFMRIICQQTIFMKYYALLVLSEKASNLKLSLLQIVGGA